ncbi:protein phosphatase 1, regulatory subunit 13Ba isoform X2 [Silurus meridionalis]|uniref:protein phosphatase 1, regulatory subunit 13Ba isoform X2 n=1 Tax=Silurus meridionalis TaxID=175797 RepID=UPI001EEADFD8|nr:protein phosphatase 1, regulatory subunit 13Ba isoform X2 [Silurus meridionalis]
MKRFWTLLVRSLVDASKSRPWLQNRIQKKEEKTDRAHRRNKNKTEPQDSAGPDKIFIPVFRSSSEQVLTEVPITSETRCKDVVEFCREAGESGCRLVQVCKGKESVMPSDHLMLEYMQKCGQRRQEVTFYLRDENEHRSSNKGTKTSEQLSRKKKGRMDRIGVNGMGTPRVELTLSELQEMAIRQQQQIEAQQQMLMAKEQRLRYLKQQDHQGPATPETEKLQRLRERVESQEAKLKKIRAMRGQVDYSKLINGNLSAEIEHVSNLFQEKQVELQQAVMKVEQLTQQIEELRNKRITESQLAGGNALELHKLYQELQMRNKLNQEQISKLQQHKDMLNKRNLEVSMMDRRIEELRDRLHRKKAELGRMSAPSSPQSVPITSGRIAAVFPYIQVPTVTGRQDGGYPLTPDTLKPHPLPAQIIHTRSRSDDDRVRKPSRPWKVSDLDIVLNREVTLDPRDHPAPNDANWNMDSLKAPDWKDTSKIPGKMAASEKGSPKVLGTITTLSKHPPLIYGTYPSVGHHSTVCATNSLPRSAPGTLSWHRSSGSSSQQIQQRITVPPSPTPSAGSPVLPPSERSNDAPLAAAVRPFYTDRGSRPQSPRKGPATMNSSSIYNVYLQQPTAKNYQSSSTRAAVKAVYGKPLLPSSVSSSPVPFQHQNSKDDSERESEPETPHTPQPSVENIPRPLSPTKLTPAHSPLRYQSDLDLEVLRRKLANAPRPLKKRSSITEPEGPNGPNIQKLLYQRFNTLAGGIETVTPFFQPDTALNLPEPATSPTSDSNENHQEQTANHTETVEITDTTDPKEGPENSHNNNQASLDEDVESTSPEKEDTRLDTVKRTNLKKPGSERTGHGLRVKFNPLALLLDASLEGEFDLVQRIIYEVDNPSTPNDEGITPLHNAVCAGHYHIVKFLLDFGVNINAADSDGWTPLHCAASCNSVHLCKLLVESGAAIFATTISDVETAADKCEEMENGYVHCSQFLYGVQEKLGMMNKGTVYALWDYEAQSPDELSFRDGDALTVLKRRDESETEWWWARINDQEGYAPRNLLGLYPRIKPRQRSLA